MLGEQTGSGPAGGSRPWHPLRTMHTLDELVLPVDAREGLQKLVTRAREARSASVDSDQDPVALVALFVGEAGTGKTLAAQVVAAELHAPILEVDTPAALSKGMAAFAAALWSIFREGQRSGAVIVFNDAGAYLADGPNPRRRAPLRHDPVDLPARCSRYPGLAIICSRVRPPVDPDSRERYSAMIEFPFPDKDAREQLWGRALPASAELSAAELDFVAHAFRLPGAAIAAVAANAVRFGTEAGQAPTRADLARALELHYKNVVVSGATQAALAQFRTGGELGMNISQPSPPPPAPAAEGASLLGRLRWSPRGRNL